jgi:hypothetical protein
MSGERRLYPQIAIFVSRNCCEEVRILGYERAYARSYPKMRGLTTGIPRELVILVYETLKSAV